MRECIYRGKRKDNGEWTYGYLFCIWERAYILWGMTNDVPNMIEVDPETIGQFTGLIDKNGKKVFEGDIVEIDGKHYEVKYMLGQFFVGINMPIAYKRFDCEVIGNIHDNPELLKDSE